MNYKNIALGLLAVAGAAAGLPLRAEQTLTAGEKAAYQEHWGENLPKDATDLRTDEEKEESRWRFGLELLASSPRQDFRNLDSRTGFGAGAFIENDLGRGWRVQSRIDYISYPQTRDSTVNGLVPFARPFSPLTLSANAASLGVEVQYHLPAAAWRRFYLLGGVRVSRYEITYTTQSVAPAPPAILTSKFRTETKFGVAVGLGLDLTRNLALSGRYTQTSVGSFSFVTYETGLAVRF